MFKIYGDRPELWQWDLNQKLIVENDTINEVHFCDGIGNCSLVCEVYELDELRVANIPNVILQDNCDMNIFAFVKTDDGSYTKHREVIKVNRRSKPADYVYTETEVKSYEMLMEKLDEIEQGLIDKIDNEYEVKLQEKLVIFNDNADLKTEEFNENAVAKTTVFNQNVVTKIEAFNENAAAERTTFNNNATSKTEVFNNNAAGKVSEYNSNADEKLNAYNSNATEKVEEYNNNADNLISNVKETRNELERIKNDVLETGEASGTFVNLKDSTMAEYQELEISGVCEQGENPSPEYPQEISVIEKELKVVSCNKNLFNKNLATQLIGYYAQDGSFINDPNNIAFVGIKLPKTEVIITSNYNLKKLIGFTTEDYTKGTVLINPINLKTTYKNNGEYKYYGFYVSKEEYEREDFYIQIEKGNIETNFEEHLETVINVNLGNEFVGKINDTVKDTLRVSYNEEDGEYHLYLDKILGKLVLNGSESWSKSGASTDSILVVNIPISNVGSNIAISDNFILNNSNVEIGTFSIYNDNHNIRLCLDVTIIATIEETKQWLSENNVEIYYALAEPYTLDLGVIGMPITYDEVTNLFTDSDLLPTINAKYYRNFTETVRNLQINNDTLKNELASIENRLSVLEAAQVSAVNESEVIE